MRKHLFLVSVLLATTPMTASCVSSPRLLSGRHA